MQCFAVEGSISMRRLVEMTACSPCFHVHGNYASLLVMLLSSPVLWCGGSIYVLRSATNLQVKLNLQEILADWAGSARNLCRFPADLPSKPMTA